MIDAHVLCVSASQAWSDLSMPSEWFIYFVPRARHRSQFLAFGMQKVCGQLLWHNFECDWWRKNDQFM